MLRHLIVAKREAELAPSPMMKEEKSRSFPDKAGERGERKESAPATAEGAAPSAPAAA